MNNKLNCLSAAILLYPFQLFCQQIEKIDFDSKDSINGYYLAVQPQSKNIKGVLLLLTSFTPPESILPETKLQNVGCVNNLLTVVVSTQQKLYADSFAVNRVNHVIKDIVKRFGADTSAFVLAGYGEAGGIALRFTELSYQNPPLCAVQPKAVFGIDAPVDLFGLWHWSENQVKKNYWPGAVGDARYYMDAMTKENGTIYTHPEKYRWLSPFNAASDSTGNEQYLRQLPVRLYYDTDIEWQLANRRNSYYDTKLPDASELIKRLLLAGNNQAALMPARVPAVRSDGTRHPTALSIVDETECIQWIKKSLHIFDPRNWAPPYTLMVPAGWSTELFSLPPDFAPFIKYKGVEDIRFAPGWGDIKSDEHWAYAFLWWIEGKPAIDAAILQQYLAAYYDGLLQRNIVPNNIPSGKLIPTTATIKKTAVAAGDLETYAGTVHMLDYHAQLPMLLHLLVHVKNTKTPDHQAILFEVSPQPLTHPVWQKLDAIEKSFGKKDL